ncbi:MAG: HAMP domain-containing sensor histidine kinase [Chthoniobacterales bacterium]
MKLPLSLRILGCFFLNLLLLGLAFWAFFRFQLHFGLDSLFAAQSMDRVVAVQRLVEDELQTTPRENWDAILKRFESAYGIQFALFDSAQTQLAGSPLALPRELRERLPPAPRQRDRPPPPREFEPDRPMPDRPPLAGPPMGPRPEERPPQLLHADAQYWISMHLRPHPSARPGPLLLVLVSKNLTAGGLIFDPKPWLIAALGVLGLSVLFWLPLVRGMTQAISEMTRATGQIAAGHFEIHAPENRSDELGTLGGSINRMASRLSAFILGQKRFLGDTAHELVSPLARMEMGLSILQSRASEKDRAHLNDVHEEVRLMSGLVNELLSFSKASLGLSPQHLQAIPLAELIDKTLKREAAGDVTRALADGLKVLGDFELLQRALGNVVRNSQRYAGDASISATRSGNEVILTVSDNGPGIPESALTQIFDPFFRVDLSRDRATGGTGLGLAITKSCVEACGGKVTCRNRTPHGLEMRFVLQAAD